MTILLIPSADMAFSNALLKCIQYPQDDGENHYFCNRIIQTMFEYIFYRLNHAYKKHEPNTNHGFSASIALSAFQFFMVGGVLIVLYGCFGIFKVPKDSIFGKIIALGFMALLILYNYKHYTPKIEEMDEKYANFPINKWLKDWLFFFLFILISLSFLFVPALLFGHLMK